MTLHSASRGNLGKVAWLIVPSLLVIIYSVLGLAKLKPNGDPRVFFDKESSEYLEVMDLEDEFSANTTLVFVVHPNSGTVFTWDTLTLIEDVTEQLWRKSHVVKVDSITNFARTQSIDDTLETNDLFDSEAHSEEDLKEMAAFAATEERLIGGLLGADLDITAIMVTLDVDRAEQTQVAEVMEWGQALVADMRQRSGPELNINIAGTVAYSDALSQATKSEVTSKLPWVFALMVLVLWLILRNLLLVFAIFYVIIMTILFTLATAGFAQIPVTPIMAFVPITLIAVVLADAIHLATSYKRELNQGVLRNQAITTAVRDNFKPMLITSLTTAIGFICLNISDSPPYRQLGNLIALGSIVAFVATVYWMPRWVSLLPASSSKPVQATAGTAGFDIAEKLLAHPKLSIIAVLGLLVALATQLPNNYLDERVDTYFDETWEIKRTNNLINEKLGGVHKIDFRLAGDDDRPITGYEYLKAISDFSDWAEQQPKVAQVLGFDQIIKTIHRQMHDDDPEYYAIPENNQLNSQYFLLYEISLPYGADPVERINADRTATRISVILHSASSSELLAFRDSANQWIEQHWPEHLQTHAVSLETTFSELNKDNSISLLQGTLLGFVLIGLVLTMTLGSFKLGLLSLFSNTFPAMAGFGIWGLKDGQVGLAVSIVAVITLGVVVDDTIHLLSKFKKLVSLPGYNAKQAAVESLRTTGVALFTTTAVLCICFGALAFSHFKPNADLGFLSASTLALALIIDVFLLLPLVMLIHQRREPEGKVVAGENK